MPLHFLSCKVKAWGKMLMDGNMRDQVVLVFIPIHIHLPSLVKVMTTAQFSRDSLQEKDM